MFTTSISKQKLLKEKDYCSSLGFSMGSIWSVISENIDIIAYIKKTKGRNAMINCDIRIKLAKVLKTDIGFNKDLIKS